MSNKPSEYQPDNKTSSDSASPPAVHCVEGFSHTGKPCRLIDNTGTVEHAQLQALLDDLIAQKLFGLQALSGAGDNTLRLDQPRITHIQFGATLYRLLLFPHEARIEKF